VRFLKRGGKFERADVSGLKLLEIAPESVSAAKKKYELQVFLH